MCKKKTNMPTRERFYYEIGDAEKSLKRDLYKRLVKIERGLRGKTITASSTDHVCGFESLATHLDGVVLHAPMYPIYGDNNKLLGWISLPDNLKEFLQTFCSGSSHIAYQILKNSKRNLRQSKIIDDISIIKKLQPIAYFIDIVDRRYYFHIGSNPKYSDRNTRTANINQLKYSEIYPTSSSKKEIGRRFLQDFQKKFDNERLPMAAYSHGLMSDEFCQYCHRPNIPKKRYCHTHEPDKKGNNSKSNSITNDFKKSFRNLGLLLRGEEEFIQSHPDEYIKKAEEERNKKAKEDGQLRLIQNNIKSEYFILLNDWACQHPIYRKFHDKTFEIFLEHFSRLDRVERESIINSLENERPDFNERLCLLDRLDRINHTNLNKRMDLVDWEHEACPELVAKILDICRREIFIDPKRIQVDISGLPPVEIKSAVLGECGLHINPDFYPDIEIWGWIAMLRRHFKYQLVIACKDEEIAKKLAYLR